ncbi:hypothetical protein TWF718_002523 [Orbilia javanica]|uniref:SET domain-containing protein n=1 Tax=Orbilia javanica TaxID=47235 RepID=A0AAN8MUC1_9PEZI
MAIRAQPKHPKLSSIIPGDISTYPHDSLLDQYTRVSSIPDMGMGVTATNDIPAGTTWYLATAMERYIPIPRKTMTAIRLAGRKHKEWKLFRDSVEMITVYSKRWDTLNYSLDAIRFLNHGIVEGEGEDGVGNVMVGGEAVGEGTLVGWSFWATRDIKEGEQLVVNYLGFNECPWSTACAQFLKGGQGVDLGKLDDETVFDDTPVEMLLTREQLMVYVQSALDRDIDKALFMIIAKWGVWDEARGLWVVRVPVDTK